MIKHAFAAMAAVGLSATGVPGAGAVDFAGKTVDFIISSSPGGGTDAMARLVGRHLEGHLPGKPKIVFRNMRGAGGIKALNYFYEKAKPDGLTIATSGVALLPQNLRKKSVRFDPTKFVYFGAFPSPGGVSIMRKKDLGRLADKSGKPVIMGGVDGNRQSSQIAVWGPAYLGWNMRFVVGYKGSSAMMLAYERGENQFTVTFDTFLLTPLRESGEHAFPVQTGIVRKGKFVRRPDFPDVPLLSELVKPKLKGLALDAFEAWESMVQVGKWYALAPGTPADIAKAYNAAFDKAVAEPAFDKDAKKIYSPIYTTQTGAEMAAVVRNLLKVSSKVLDFQDGLKRKVGIPVGAKKKREKRKKRN